MGEWIKCSERLPDPETLVIYYFECVGTHIGKMQAGATCKSDACFYGISGFLTGDVTHWQPLPEPPHD